MVLWGHLQYNIWMLRKNSWDSLHISRNSAVGQVIYNMSFWRVNVMRFCCSETCEVNFRPWAEHSCASNASVWSSSASWIFHSIASYMIWHRFKLKVGPPQDTKHPKTQDTIRFDIQAETEKSWNKFFKIILNGLLTHRSFQTCLIFWLLGT